MDIENIKNKALKELVMTVEKNDASATIGADLEDALNEATGGIAVKDVQTQSPLSPQTPQNPLVSLAGAIRQYLKERGIWQTIEGKFTLNDEVSRQVRKDTVRFGIDERFRMGT